MNHWLRRLIYTLITLVWLFIMLLPVFAFVLAARGELRFGGSPQNQVRFFMVQQPDAAGVGMEWTRPLRQPDNCTRTSVRYLLWEGEGEPVNTCRCYTAAGDVIAPDQADCEP
jgi:hypothetical protein